MTMLARIISDLRERRLWPVALVMLAAIVAVPFVLAKSPAPAPPAPTPVASASTAVRASLPSVSVSTTPSHSALHAKPRNPFTPPKQSKSVTTTSTTKSAAGSGNSPAKSSGTSRTTSPSSNAGSSGGSSGATSTTPHTIPAGHAKPAPTGLAANQTYEVTLAATDTSGGLDTTPGLERLSPVPSRANPLLVELGVLKGGRRILFAVLPGTRVSGPGTCTPGPIDCEVMALGVNQIETVSSLAAGAPPATQFAVTAVTVADHPSAAATRKARTTESADGHRLLSGAGLDATLSLFPYDAGLGAILDQRNLSAGGN